MKLAAKEYADFLRAPARRSRACLIYGPDAGRVRESARSAASAVLGGDLSDSFRFIEMTEEMLKADLTRLADELCSPSLMGGSRALLLRDATDKSSAAIEEALSRDWAEAYLIICAGELTPRSAIRALFEKQTDLAAMACYHDEERDLGGLVRNALSAHNVRADNATMGWIASQLGNDRMVTQSELAKLVLYAGDGGTLTLEDARAVIAHNRDVEFEDLCNAVADRNLVQLSAVNAQLAREGTQPVAMVRSLLKYFQKLYSMKIQCAQGASAEQAVAAVKPPVFFKQVPILTRQLKSWELSQLGEALARLQQLEGMCKSGTVPPIVYCAQTLLEIASQSRRAA